MELTVSLLVASTSIMPRRRFWQSGGMKCGMWNTPSFTFSSRFLRLSSSNGRAPCRGEGKRQRVIRRGQVVEREKVWTQKISLCSIEGRRETGKKEFEWLTRLARRNKTTFWVLILHHLKNRLAFSTCSTLQLETLCPEPRGKINNKQQRAENRAFSNNYPAFSFTSFV